MACESTTQTRVETLINLIAQNDWFSVEQCTKVGYTQDQCIALKDAVEERILRDDSVLDTVQEAQGEITDNDVAKLKAAGIPDDEIGSIKDKATLARLDHLFSAYEEDESSNAPLTEIARIGQRRRDVVLPRLRGLFSDPKKDSTEWPVYALGWLDDRDSIPLLRRIATSDDYSGEIQVASIKVLCNFFDDPKLPEIFLAHPSMAGVCSVEAYDAKFSDTVELGGHLEKMLRRKESVYSKNELGEFAAGLLQKYAAELGDKEAIRLADISFEKHPQASSSDLIIRKHLFETIRSLPDSNELKDLLKKLAWVTPKDREDASYFALSELAHRGYKDVLAQLFASYFAKSIVPIFSKSFVDTLPIIMELQDETKVGDILSKAVDLKVVAEAALPYLENIVKYNGNASVRAQATKLIATHIIDNGEIDILLLATEDADAEVRDIAGAALVRHGAIGKILTRFKSDRPEVRMSAIRAVGSYEDMESAYTLVSSHFRREKDESVKDEARKAIKNICSKNPDFCSEKLLKSLTKK